MGGGGVLLQKNCKLNILHTPPPTPQVITSVTDPDPLDTDPDPAFHFDADQDPAFQFDMDWDLTV